MELHRGNVVLLKRPLADLLCIVNSMSGDKVGVRYIDSPPDEPEVVLEVGDVIKLAEEQSKELPTHFMTAIERQRQIVFAPKKQVAKSVSGGMKGLSDDVYSQIMQILSEDGKGGE